MANEFILSGDDMELMGMGRGFLSRLKRRAIREHNPLTQLRRARRVSRSAISGDDLEMMGMGRSFLRRQASRASKIVRPLASKALSVASKIPVYGQGVSMFRSLTASAPKPVVLVPGGALTRKTAPPSATGSKSKMPLILGAVALGVGGLYLATKNHGA